MGMKEWLQRVQPTPLHVVLVLSLVHFSAQLIICYVTHAITLLLDSCHMLCNIIALVGCIVTVKYDSQHPINLSEKAPEVSTISEDRSDTITSSQSAQQQVKSLKRSNDEKRLRNTFGWARIEVLTMLVVCVFFASLCLSVVLEAAQTLIHIGHMDAMHNPIVVFSMGAIGLCLNIFCYLLIGGYTFHQGSFIQVTSSGCVVLEGVATTDSVRQGQRRLSRSKKPTVLPKTKQRQGLVEALRDVLSCFLVMVCAVIVYFVDGSLAKFVDPAIAILSSFLLFSLTYPYMKESGMILLQTIPGAMDIELLKHELLKSFPCIVNVHDFHVWQLNSSNIIATVHVIFPSPADYTKHRDDIRSFFLEEGITQVTIQPEFASTNTMLCITVQAMCLMTCVGKGCLSKHCCNQHEFSTENLTTVVVDSKEEKEEIKCNEDNTKTENVPNEIETPVHPSSSTDKEVPS